MENSLLWSNLSQVPVDWVWGAWMPKFCGLLSGFLLIPKTQKNKHLPKLAKIIKKRSSCAQGFDFHRFVMPSGIHFSCYFMIQQNLLKCDMSNAKCLFLLFKATYFGIKNPSQTCVFPRRLPGYPFWWFDVDFVRKWSLWGTRQNPVGAKTRRHQLVSGVVEQENVESG